jgi:hypothetical protein
MDKIVAKLDQIISVKNIMTPVEDMEVATSIEEATPLFVQYDVVPYSKMGLIEGFFLRDSVAISEMKVDCLISDSTSLLTLPQLLKQTSFRFVISSDRVAGYIHYSDLNKPVMKLPLFALMLSVEKQLWDKIKGDITEAIVREVFQGNAQKFINKQNAARGSNVDIGWIGIFTLPSILKLAKYFEKTNLTGAQEKLLVAIRNKVSHADKNLIDKQSDVSELVEAIKLCQLMLKIECD